MEKTIHIVIMAVYGPLLLLSLFSAPGETRSYHDFSFSQNLSSCLTKLPPFSLQGRNIKTYKIIWENEDLFSKFFIFTKIPVLKF